jgi:hypothetical protein
MTNKPNSRLVNDRHHDTTDDHGNKIPNICVNLQTNSTKDISTESQELYIKTDTKLVSLQREMRLNEIKLERHICLPYPPLVPIVIYIWETRDQPGPGSFPKRGP